LQGLASLAAHESGLDLGRAVSPLFTAPEPASAGDNYRLKRVREKKEDEVLSGTTEVGP